ncbi:PREDICTED: bifunctional epoxide hydrolase 2-like isoform X2 [Nelumbo nucifera]|uniref:Bifunctional epoxide hydrolase 2-like isoform X2 n=1 Tax=Nelumbo nucifera TaxID=4432 RepID=A0A1U7ZD68_NELNU|nr:PREDICTED: bifunctional epoxide hydrolase 2-like isoform X2 [Nelumbo nucifera]
MDQNQIEHKYVDARGLTLHVAEIGNGPTAVVFLHGFPEIWYSWRHQMVAVANAGFRAIAPDFRGYGLSQQPPELEKTSFKDLIDDLLVILDSLCISKESGRAEADFGRFDVKTVVRNIYILFSRSEVPIAKENQEIMDLVEPSTPLPFWFTDEDLKMYATLYEKSGFRTALQVPYRSLHGELSITDPKVEVPALLIMGEKDYVLKFPEMEEYIKSGKVKDYVTDLEITLMPEGTHFIQEQIPEQVNSFITSFLNNHT